MARQCYEVAIANIPGAHEAARPFDVDGWVGVGFEHVPLYFCRARGLKDIGVAAAMIAGDGRQDAGVRMGSGGGGSNLIQNGRDGRLGRLIERHDGDLSARKPETRQCVIGDQSRVAMLGVAGVAPN